MAIEFQLDPAEVLGVPAGAPLKAIRDAYHEKARRHHPDQGGESWAFRVVRRSYEVLSTARVVGRASEEFSRDHARPPIRPAAAPASDPAMAEESVRPGVRDDLADPSRLVDVELFLVRFQLDDPVELLTLPPEQRNLSCCLHVSWPSRELGRPATDASGPILAAVGAAFDALARRAEGVANRSNADGGRFVGWLNYPTAILASEAAKAFRAALQARGLGVVQTTRETIIPRDGL